MPDSPGQLIVTTADDAEVERLLGESQWFLALDAARTALERAPWSIKLQRYAALALLRLGAAEESRKILEPICLPRNLDDPIFVLLYQQFRQAAGDLMAQPAASRGPSGSLPQDQASRDALLNFADLLGVVGRATERIASARATDEETLGLLGSTYKELWKESGKLIDAQRSRDLYLRAFQSTGGYWTCINAATMSWAVGRMEAATGQTLAAQREQAQATELAAKVAEVCHRQIPDATGVSRFWLLATLGEALLHLGKETEAVAAYDQAARLPGLKDRQRISAADQLRLLRHWGLQIPQAILTGLRLPQVAVFVGHMIDEPGRSPPRFPAEREPQVRQEIERHLTELDIRIAYGSAACGADLIFIEAMQDRDGEVNIVLPFDIEDFVKTSIDYAGPQWLRRFQRAIKLAGNHVTYATPERYFGTVGLLSYANQIIHGLAYLRARSMGTEPYLLGVYDGASPALGGGTADVISRWTDKSRLRIVPLAAVSDGEAMTPAHPSQTPLQTPLQTPSQAPMQDTSQSPASESAPPTAATRVVRSILFADVVGFSALPEAQVPYFMYDFLNEVALHLKQLPDQPRMVNTWGDAVFAVMDNALPMVEYARTLQRIVCTTDWRKLGMPAEMSVRISLHIGPVFQGTDAITERMNFFGSHVNRAARLEPVTVPGYIYATQQFVALLTSEQRSMAEPPGGWTFTCEYLGRLNLAKNYGVMPVYSIRGRHGG